MVISHVDLCVHVFIMFMMHLCMFFFCFFFYFFFFWEGGGGWGGGEGSLYCSAQLSMFNMEKLYGKKIIIIMYSLSNLLTKLFIFRSFTDSSAGSPRHFNAPAQWPRETGQAEEPDTHPMLWPVLHAHPSCCPVTLHQAPIPVFQSDTNSFIHLGI